MLKKLITLGVLASTSRAAQERDVNLERALELSRRTAERAAHDDFTSDIVRINARYTANADTEFDRETERAIQLSQPSLANRIGSWFGSWFPGSSDTDQEQTAAERSWQRNQDTQDEIVRNVMARTASSNSEQRSPEVPCRFGRVDLPNNLTKWAIPCQLTEGKVAACTAYCASLGDSLIQKFPTQTPRGSLTPAQAETMTRTAFTWGAGMFEHVKATRRQRGQQENGRLEANELETFVPDLPLIRNNRYAGSRIRCAEGQIADLLDDVQSVYQGITDALRNYRVVFIADQNSATSGFFQQGNSTNGFYVDTHLNPDRAGGDPAGEITYGSISSLQNYLITRFENRQGEMFLYCYGRR